MMREQLETIKMRSFMRSYPQIMREELQKLKELNAPKSMFIKLYIKLLSICLDGPAPNGYIKPIYNNSKTRFDDMFLGMCKELKIEIDENDLMQAKLLC